MKLTHYIYIASLIATVTACSNDDSYTVGEDENAIKLFAGIVSSANISDMTSRASGGDVEMLKDTKIRLQVSGEWTGHTPSTVTQTTDGTTGDYYNNGNIIRIVNCNPTLYWDDYGTADPNNRKKDGETTDKGRDKGLTIYGAAVNKASTEITAVSDFTAYTWTVPTDQTSDWSDKDLLITNNVSGLGAATDDAANKQRYNFSERNDGKLLEFTHAMSKVTINLTAGKGFVDGKFVNEPTVALLGFPVTGIVNITNGELSNAGTGTEITKTHLRNPESWTPSCSGSVTRDAIVFPTRTLASTDQIAKIEADGNIYYVTAKELVAKLGTDTQMKSGVNYILNITVNKTEIKVTATIKDWTTVKAEKEEPVIKVASTVGETSTDKQDGFTSFDFYLSTTDAASGYGNTAAATASGTKTDGKTAWTFDPNLYWPSHNTHYFMRGVYPASTTVTNGIISVANNDYDASSSPSNLLVGAPVISTGTMCGSSDHTPVDMSTSGICAREATINLHFNYMMSQVEVHLTTPSSGNDIVNLTDAKVEIVNGYIAGDVDIHTKTVAVTGTTSDFQVKHVGEENANYRHSIVVPQSLSNGEGESAKDLQFKITITNTNGTTDVYFATIKNIKVKEGDAAAATISAWESGKHYIYTLDMRKTEVKVSASITDWATVTGNDDIWF